MTTKAPARNEWTTGLFKCCEQPTGCGFCLYALFCPCCAYGSNVELMEPVVCCGGQCCGACFAYTGMAYIGCPCILQMMARGYIRNKYGIPGSGCGDFMTTWCCAPCAMCQERRELLIRGHGKGGVIQGSHQALQAPQQAPQEQQMVMTAAPVPQPGYYPPPQPGYYPPPQPGYYPPPQPGYNPPPQPGYYPPPQPAYCPPPQPGFPVPQPGYPAQPPPQGYYPPVPQEAAAQGKVA